jgi:hypothetical protein
MRPMLRPLLLLALLAACGSKAAAPTPDAAAPDAAGAGAPTPIPLPIAERPHGPTRAACESLIAHMKDALIQSDPSLSSAEQKAYAAGVLKEYAPRGLGYCLQIASAKEVDCLIAAKSTEEMTKCERFRRELPADLVERDQVTLGDCELLFDRLRQFKIEEAGVAPVELDATRDQIIRSCVEKAKVGTVACFLASPSYEQARRCP